MTADQLLAVLALVSGAAGAALTATLYTLAQRTRDRARRWAYSPRRSFGTARVKTLDEQLTDAMRRHPAGSRR